MSRSQSEIRHSVDLGSFASGPARLRWVTRLKARKTVFCSKTGTMKAADTSPVELTPDDAVTVSVKVSFRETNQRKACLLHL